MKYGYYFSVLILISTLIIACDNIPDNSCSGVVCDAPMFMIGLEYIDADTEEDLIFGEAASYSIDDLSVESLDSEIEYSVTVDSTLTDKKIAMIYGSVSDTIKLTLGELSADTLYVNTLYRDVGCCGEIELQEVQLNEVIICTDCDAPTVVEVLK